MSGSGWESNPPPLAPRDRPPVLKTGASTGTQPLPKYGYHYSQIRGLKQPGTNLTALYRLDRINIALRQSLDHLPG